MKNEHLLTIKRYLADHNQEALLVSSSTDQYYLANYTGDDGYIVIDPEHTYIVTDGRFFEQIKEENSELVIVDIAQNSLAEFLAQNYQTIAIQPDSLNARDYMAIAAQNIKMVPADLLVEKMRMHKTSEEIALIKQAAEIADKIYEHIIDFMKIGMTEKQVADEIELMGKKLGADKLAFETIVASGARSAFPHGDATDKIIEDGDVVILDFGFFFHNYCSDITRTVVMGHSNAEFEKVYQTVQKAENLGMEFAPMVETFGDLDRVIRGAVDDGGFGDYFNHGSGHGLGLQVHDYPTVRRSNNDQLESQIVFTVEPGVYLPNKFGVRIEDDIYKDETGQVIKLTNSTNEIIIVK